MEYWCCLGGRLIIIVNISFLMIRVLDHVIEISHQNILSIRNFDQYSDVHMFPPQMADDDRPRPSARELRREAIRNEKDEKMYKSLNLLITYKYIILL